MSNEILTTVKSISRSAAATALAACVLAAAALSGCSRGADASSSRNWAEAREPADLRGCRCGFVVGGSLQEFLSRLQPEMQFVSFNDYPSSVEALRIGKIDILPIDTVMAKRWVASRPDELSIAFTIPGNPNGYFLAKGSPLRERVNAVLARMRESGEIDRIIAKWCDTPDLAAVAPEEWTPPPGYTGAEGPLRIAITGDAEPGIFFRGDRPAGFDIDILNRVALELNRKPVTILVNLSGLVAAVQSGKADIGGGCITITAERAEKVDFTDCYFDGGYAVTVRRPDAAAAGIRTPADLAGRHVAHMSSDFHRQGLRKLQPDVLFDPYSEYSFAVESLRKRKLDAISLGRRYADLWMAKFPGEFRVAFDYADDTCCFMMPKGSDLRPRLDAELRKMNAAGETEAIIERWMKATKAGSLPPPPDLPEPPAGAPVLRVASAAQSEPWCLVADGEVRGIDIDILATAASRMGVGLRPKVFSWGGMVDCVNAGRCEIACGGIYTAGNTFPTLDVSEKYADERMCLLVRDETFRSASGLSELVRSLRESFVRTFVTEDRWRMLAQGFGVTVMITLLSALLGTALAFPVWLARTSRIAVVSALARAYISVLQGTPVLVLLMVLFYIVFGSVDIDGIWVAVTGFALNLSAYAGEMLRSGVGSVPRGQTEAALALGYPPRRAFTRFVLPQAVKAILPVYRGELIGLLKSTSIVGYIAIGDLTKASDLVRSRTYESFFPIITTAIVYFLAAGALAWALERAGRRLGPPAHRAA